MKRPKKLLRQLNRMTGTRGSLDTYALNRFSGWAVTRGGKDTHIEAWIDGSLAASTTTGVERPDVELLLPGYERARFSGFTLEVPESAIPQDRVVDVKITARGDRALAPKAWLGTATLAGDGLLEKLASAPSSGVVGPFPPPVIDIVAAYQPEVVKDLLSLSGQLRFIAALRKILLVPALREIPAIADYARYLNAIASHFAFVERFFPSVNRQARAGSADFHGKPNSVGEIQSIAHQLYVLKAYGIEGDFAEFGCFKGFSSSMLSFACQQLGLKMHIFDSFEGLPEAKHSGYTEGDYAGSLEEVTENLRRLGSLDQVTFHKGFYADTFRDYRPPQLMCLWMDVDLEVSAKDMIVVADRLDPRSSLFSHECIADMLSDGEIVNAPRPDNPIPPVLDRFEELGRPLNRATPSRTYRRLLAALGRHSRHASRCLEEPSADPSKRHIEIAARTFENFSKRFQGSPSVRPSNISRYKIRQALPRRAPDRISDIQKRVSCRFHRSGEDTRPRPEC